MTQENYRKAIQDAEEEVTRLALYRASVDRKIAQLKTAITALSSLLEEPPKAEDPTAIGDAGISNAIRQILKTANTVLTPAQIKTKLIEADFDLSKYANPSAVIHNTLKRLEGQEEVMGVKTPSGTTTYAMNYLAGLDKAMTEVREKFGNLVVDIPSMPQIPIPQFPSFADATGQALTDHFDAFAKQQAEMQEMAEKAFGKLPGGSK